ncbi:MAG: metallophosphoesterase [Oscillospiraceae bacterium]
MKILVFSDSHRNVEAMVSVVEFEKPDYIFHLGDLESDAIELGRRYYNMPICSVPGNCDLMPFGERRLIFDMCGKKFFVTHGHAYGVKTGLNSLINTAMTAGADIVMFGHTHVPYEGRFGDMLVINPGSVGTGSRTYGVLTIENGEVKYENLNR